jgi:hypothetical protein
MKKIVIILDNASLATSPSVSDFGIFFFEVHDFSFFDSCSEILFLNDVAHRT